MVRWSLATESVSQALPGVVDLHVVDAAGPVQAGHDAFRPVAAVDHGQLLLADRRGDVVLGDDDARRIAARPRTELEFQRNGSGPRIRARYFASSCLWNVMVLRGGAPIPGHPW